MKYIVQFSGGKDSTAMLLMMLERGMPVDDIIFCDVGMEFPEVYEHIKKVEVYIGRKITKLKAQYSFEYYMCDIPKTGKHSDQLGYGWPRMFNRWCTGRMKERVTTHYLRGIGEYILFIGIAADEPKRHKNIPANVRHPLYDWGVTEAQALQYCKGKGLDFGGLYDRFKRLGCYCCPLQKISELRKVRRYYPELWSEIQRLDKKAPYSFLPRYTAEQLERRFALEDAQCCLWGDDSCGK